MTNFLSFIITWINVPLNAAGEYLLSPISILPGWLSNTIIAAITGILLLIIFKHTSNQQAIGRVRDEIKANMLALKLFKDSLWVTLRLQGQLFRDALLLLAHSIVPLVIMIVPVSLLLSQLGLWYQYRPLKINEETIIAVKLSNEVKQPWPKITIQPTKALKVIIGPVNIVNQRQIYWQIKTLQNGYHHIVFQINEKQIKKELAIGEGFMRISAKRPGWHWLDILLHPAEKPFSSDSIIQSISIDYPHRSGLVCGTDWWVFYFFAISLISALLFKPFLKVKI